MNVLLSDYLAQQTDEQGATHQSAPASHSAHREHELQFIDIQVSLGIIDVDSVRSPLLYSTNRSVLQ